MRILAKASQNFIELQQFFAAKKSRQALKSSDELIKLIGQGCREINMMKAETLIDLGRIEEGFNLTNSLMKVASAGDVDLLNLRAKCLYQMGDCENSLKHLQQAMRSDPDNVKIRSMLRKVKEIEESKEFGNNAFKSENYTAAIEAWTSCISKLSDNAKYVAKILSNRASAYAKLNLHERAIDDCSAAIKADSTFWKAYLKRADSCYLLGGVEKITQSISDYEKVIELREDQGNEINKKLKQVCAAF